MRTIQKESLEIFKTNIYIPRDIGSKVAEQVCENDIVNRKINTFKCLVSGNISLSWNEDNTFIKYL